MTFFKSHQQTNASSLNEQLKNYIIIAVDKYRNKEFLGEILTLEKELTVVKGNVLHIREAWFSMSDT